MIYSKRCSHRDLCVLRKTVCLEEAILIFIRKDSSDNPFSFLVLCFLCFLNDIVNELYVSYSDQISSICVSYSIKIKERILISLERRVVNMEESMERSNIFFSGIAAVTSFIDLFGTIWGVMKCFNNFSHIEFSNFSSMFTSVAEALVLSGLGLFVAIPAVVIYNL